MIKISSKGKPITIPTKKMIGHAVSDNLNIKFEFEVPATADEDDIISKMAETFSEMFQMFYEEVD